MIVSIHQPNFLPWVGYFHKIINSDIFVFFDDVQFPVGKSFGNRVLIKDFNNSFWINVPVSKRSEKLLFNEVKIRNDNLWKKKLLKTIEFSYRKSVFFNEIFPKLEFVINKDYNYLSDFNMDLIKEILEYLCISTKLIKSSEIKESEGMSGIEKLSTILKHLNAKTYLSGKGKGSLRHIDETRLIESGINLQWQSFNHPVYTQQGNSFIKTLSIIDILFNEGFASKELLLKN